MTWPTTADGQYYLFDGQVLMPVNPETGAPILMLRPQGGMGVGIPAIADGAPGPAPVFQEETTFTELAHDDPTPGSLSVVQISPGPPPVYALVGALHRGTPGTDGTTSINLASIDGTAAAGKLIRVNPEVDGFEYIFEKVGERYIPALINNTGSGNANSTLATVSIPAKNFNYRPLVIGHTIVTQNGGSNVIVDLLVRLNNETGGNIVGHCPGIGGTERLTLSSGPPAGAADTFDKVLSGNAATLYLRTEQQGGSNSYTTSNSTTRFEVWAIPLI